MSTRGRRTRLKQSSHDCHWYILISPRVLYPISDGILEEEEGQECPRVFMQIECSTNVPQAMYLTIQRRGYCIAYCDRKHDTGVFVTYLIYVLSGTSVKWHKCE